MDYNNLLENYGLIKNKVDKLLDSVDRDYVKDELDKIKDNNFKKIVKCQYLYLFQKKMNILKDNKSLRIIQLEVNMKNIENKNIDEVMKILNKLGYNEILLLLLNISKELIEKIKIASGNNTIKYNVIEDSKGTEEEHLNKLINKITETVLEKYKKEIKLGSNNVNIIYKGKKKYIDSIENRVEDIEDIKDLADIEDLADVEDVEDDEDDKASIKQVINIKKDMKKLIPTFVDKEEEEEVEGEEEDENGKKKKIKEIKSQRITLSKDDMNMIGEL